MKGRLRAAAIALLVGLAFGAPARPALAEVEAAQPTSAGAAAPKKSAPPLPPEYIVQEDGWIRLAYHPSMRERARSLAEELGAYRGELRDELGAEVLTSIEVRVAAAVPGEIDRLAPSRPKGPSSAATFTELSLIVLAPPSPLDLATKSLADALRRELARLAIDQALAGPAGLAPPEATASKVPEWLRDGYAAHRARENAALRAQTLWMASIQGRLMSLSAIGAAASEGGSPEASTARAEAADFVRFLMQPGTGKRFAAFLSAARGGAPFERALSDAYAQSFPEMELAFRKELARRYSFMPVLVVSMAVLMAVWAVIAARRARPSREARPLFVRSARRLEGEARARSAGVVPSRAALVSRARSLRQEGEVMLGPPRQDAGVPKVEHEGEWHTLH